MASSDSFSSCLEDLTCRLPSFHLPVFLLLSLIPLFNAVSEVHIILSLGFEANRHSPNHDRRRDVVPNAFGTYRVFE